MLMYCLYLKYHKPSSDIRIKYPLGSWFLAFYENIDALNAHIKRVKDNKDGCLDANSAVIKSLECPYQHPEGKCEAWEQRRYRNKPNGCEIDCDICSNISKFCDTFPKTPE